MLDQLNQEAESVGGSWVKLQHKSDGHLEGELVDYDTRPLMWQGEPVLRRSDQKPREEGVLTVRVDQGERVDADDDGIRMVSLKERGRSALAIAIKESGTKAVAGGRIKIGVKTDRETPTSQPEYQARYTPPAKAINVPDVAAPQGDQSDPFDEF